MSTDFNREVNDILFKLSDINLEEEVSFNLAIGEKLIGGAILRPVLHPIGRCTKFDLGVCLWPMEIKYVFS